MQKYSKLFEFCSLIYTPYKQVFHVVSGQPKESVLSGTLKAPKLRPCFNFALLGCKLDLTREKNLV